MVVFPDADEPVAVLLSELVGRAVAEIMLNAPAVGERRLTFEAARDQTGIVAVDVETGSGWYLLGAAVTGPTTGGRLTRFPHIDTFWFAQAAFEPETEVIRLD